MISVPHLNPLISACSCVGARETVLPHPQQRIDVHVSISPVASAAGQHDYRYTHINIRTGKVFQMFMGSPAGGERSDVAIGFHQSVVTVMISIGISSPGYR